MSFRLSRRAGIDLRRIYFASARLFGPAQADRYSRRLRRAIELIARNPQLAHERQDLSPPVRVHPCGSHIIIYIIENDADVLILRIRHAREDWAKD
ncbi:type II toxin-antitoxin system RelE/ParE family toxin [Jiella sp. M17.18]|uniref:type II toxin-antitoxin system RelE/ParE family toxin n=1 Tax=Jiella sp. M17.18 TaxID=3234247 RepID=UPI0034DEC17F